MSDYKSAPSGDEEDDSTRPWRPPTPPQEEEKSWISGLKNKIKQITDGEVDDKNTKGDLSESNMESASSAISQVGLGYDESLLMIPNKLVPSRSESSFFQPNLAQTGEYTPPDLNFSKNATHYENDPGLDIEEQVREQCSLFYAGTDESPPHPAKSLRFQLDSDQPLVEEKESWPLVASSSTGIQADLRRSSLYQVIEGRMQLYLPTDNVRLLMDPLLEPGVLSVVKEKGPITKPPSYVLTVDEHLYQRLIKEISARNQACGLYFCCHESEDHVHIGVAMAILGVIFILLFVSTIMYPV